MDGTNTALTIIIALVLIALLIWNLVDLYGFKTATEITTVNSKSKTLFWVNLIGGLIIIVCFIILTVRNNNIYNKYKSKVTKPQTFTESPAYYIPAGQQVEMQQLAPSQQTMSYPTLLEQQPNYRSQTQFPYIS